MSGARILLAHAERGEDLAASRPVGELPLGTVSYGEPDAEGPTFEALVEGGTEEVDLPRPAADDSPAVISFTSGSTGPAKGVTHSHESLRWMIAGANAAFGLTAEDAFLPGSSISHNPHGLES